MKVSLAAQTLSRSVAVALRVLRDLGYAQFKDCEATAGFIEVMQFVVKHCRYLVKILITQDIQCLFSDH